MRWALFFAAVSGLVAVAIDAWTIHRGTVLLDEQARGWMRTAIEYQAWHSLVLLVVALLMAVRPGRFLLSAAVAFALGIVLFAGSLYGLALTHLRLFLFLTPVGGTAFLAGWLLLAIYALALGRRN